MKIEIMRYIFCVLLMMVGLAACGKSKPPPIAELIKAGKPPLEVKMVRGAYRGSPTFIISYSNVTSDAFVERITGSIFFFDKRDKVLPDVIPVNWVAQTLENIGPGIVAERQILPVSDKAVSAKCVLKEVRYRLLSTKLMNYDGDPLLKWENRDYDAAVATKKAK